MVVGLEYPESSGHCGTVPGLIVPSYDYSWFLEAYEDRPQFWKDWMPWLRSKGYRLYEHFGEGLARPSDRRSCQLATAEVKYPYAKAHDTTSEGRVFWSQVPVYPAVNANQQDVVLKPVPNDGSELNIYKHLTSSASIFSGEDNPIMPILDIITANDDFSFIVMPRWGPVLCLSRTGFDRFGTAVLFMESMLKALAFLHENLIAHRDIKLGNIMVNYYLDCSILFDCRQFFASRKTRFVLTDFNLSVMFPPNTPPASRVCPASESDYGTYEYHPADVANGETTYDPFAYDVACLGGLFCEVAGHLTPLFPPLAPFLDSMIDPDIPSRLTAAEALKAFLELTAKLSPQLLERQVPRPPKECIWQAEDRWAGLPEEFVKEYTASRPPVRPRRKEFDDDWNCYYLEWNAPCPYNR